ncbi:MAG: C25 family cysteine peptidase [Limisphaerales bacterium]
MRSTIRLFLSLGLFLAGFDSHARTPDQGVTNPFVAAQTRWVIVAAPAFRIAVAPLIEQRRVEGFQVTVVETTNLLTRDQIWQGEGRPLQAYIERRFQRSNAPTFLLLAGAMRAPDASAAEQTVVPGLSGATGRMKGQPSDHGYSLPDSDGTPRVAVGRFPGRTVEEMQSMVRKTLALEQDRRPGSWRNRMVLLQGNPGGGPLAEMFAEQATAPRIQRLNPAYNLQAISDMGASIFYLPTSGFRRAALECLQEGELFSFYLGHSDASGLWSGSAYFMSRDDWANLRIPHGGGVFFTCGCYACQWGSAKDEGMGSPPCATRLARQR